MNADDERTVSVRIPDAEDLDNLDAGRWYIAVPAPLVHCAINTLQAVLAQWTVNEDNEADDEKWAPILAATGSVLGGLMQANATRDSQEGARRLVQQIRGFCGRWNTRRQLGALRGQPETDYIVDALLALHEEAERRHKQRMAERWPAPSQPTPAGQSAEEQKSAGENDVGWDF